MLGQTVGEFHLFGLPQILKKKPRDAAFYVDPQGFEPRLF
jgi:hypothetical protein